MSQAATSAVPMSAVNVRAHLVDTLRRDLVGPAPGLDDDLAHEILPAPPRAWYLTGYLKPKRELETAASNPAAAEGELGAIQGGANPVDDGADDVAATGRSFRPSSMGISALLPGGTQGIEACATWGDYKAMDLPAFEGAAPEAEDDTPQQGMLSALRWQRVPGAATLRLPLRPDGVLSHHDLPSSFGLHLAVLCRPVRLRIDEVARDLLAVQVFLVNDRQPLASREDEAYAFQVAIELRFEEGFVPRPDLRSAEARDWDQQVNDLHFAQVGELAVGHNVAAEWDDGSPCRRVCTAWIPLAMVPRVEPHEAIPGERDMAVLGALPDIAAAHTALDPLPAAYRIWITTQQPLLAGLTPGRRTVAVTLLQHAEVAAGRIEAGIAALADPDVLDAFRLANRAEWRSRPGVVRRRSAGATGSPSTLRQAGPRSGIRSSSPSSYWACPASRIRTIPTVNTWICFSSRPAAARRRHTSAWQPSRSGCAVVAIRA